MTNVKTIVKWLPATEEWVARIFIDGQRQAARDYYTNDKDDAENTAAAMLAEEHRRQVQVKRPYRYRALPCDYEGGPRS